MEDTSRTGGIRALVEMGNGLIRRGHQFSFVLPRGVRAIPFETTAQTVRVGPYLPRIPNGRNLANMFLLGWFAPEADVVVASSWRSSFATYRNARKHSAVGAYFVQADERLLLPGTPLGQLKRRIVERAYRLPLYRLSNSVWLQDRLHTEFGGDAVVVNPGVNTQVFTPAVKGGCHRDEQRPYTVVSIGRSVPTKGLQDLLEALDRVVAEADIRLVLVSQEDLRPQTPYSVQVVRGQSDQDIAEIYRSADLFVYPSWFEGFGLPPLEAMACGVPVVTTDCGGVREYAVDNVNALVVPAQDPSSMATAILRLLKDPSLAERIACSGLATAREFTWDKFAGKVEEAFQGMLGY